MKLRICLSFLGDKNGLTKNKHMNIIKYVHMNEHKNIMRGDVMANNEKNNEFLAAHEDVVKRVLESQPAEEVLYDLAELFKVFGDSTRIRILYALIESELCVGDIAQMLNLGQSAVSHQLKLLKDAKLVKFRREGKVIFYALNDDHVRTILNMGMEHIEE